MTINRRVRSVDTELVVLIFRIKNIGRRFLASAHAVLLIQAMPGVPKAGVETPLIDSIYPEASMPPFIACHRDTGLYHLNERTRASDA
jgi:hypothetical protein